MFGAIILSEAQCSSLDVGVHVCCNQTRRTTEHSDVLSLCMQAFVAAAVKKLAIRKRDSAAFSVTKPQAAVLLK